VADICSRRPATRFEKTPGQFGAFRLGIRLDPRQTVAAHPIADGFCRVNAVVTSSRADVTQVTARRGRRKPLREDHTVANKLAQAADVAKELSRFSG